MASYNSAWMEIAATFRASLRSVGTPCTLASVGIYLHRKGYLPAAGKRTLALLAQHVRNDGAEDHYLTPHRIIQMNILKAWSIQLQSFQGQRMVDWLDEYSVNCDAWDEFRIGNHGDPNAHTSSFLPLLPYSSSDTNIGGSFKSGQPRPPISAAAEFRKGIKLDKSH